MTISAFLPVYNEEKRIADALTSLMWCDEIIIIDKISTDRTIEIAKEFGEKVKIYQIENSNVYDSREWFVFLDNCTCDWVLLFTASDVIHPKLAEKILNCIKEDLDDIIEIPYRRYILGIDSPKSPWHVKLNPSVIRKSVIKLNKDGVHNAISFNGNIKKLEYSIENCMYHLTHESVDIMMDRHLRYIRKEVQNVDVTLKQLIIRILKTTVSLLFRKRIISLGFKGFALLFSYLSYQMLQFIYLWEKEQSEANSIYREIRNKINLEWLNSNKK
ncbi:MAG: hypothetical protein RL259_88 [Bacteroidota bacterium]|jgi:glycosyltransferase involved in cell wall biosynthesis